ncbi:MAG TPA: hypothetical protein VFW73_04295 [Lacipirellulaceae bacterium]|nr:hypothetical protein [Lacipirellulaceae bacterium]
MMANNDSSNTLDRLGSSLTSAILGGLILWIGQTTFRHAGILASMDEKIVAINKQFSVVDQRQESMRKWLESVVGDIRDRNSSQFTQADGEKLATQVRLAEQSSVELERRFADRLSALDVKLAAIETERRDSKEVASLKMEIAQLRSDLNRACVARDAQSPSGERYARETPAFLPPIETRR